MNEAEAILPDSDEAPPPPRRLAGSLARAVAQIGGFLLGLSLLGWVIAKALSAENREQLQRLADASALDVALLLLVSAVSVLTNGTVFWVAVRPVKRLWWRDVQAVNAVASTLAYLPFKLSLLFRFLVHNRRDGIPVLTIGAWMGCVVASMALALVPALGASVWRTGIDRWWWFGAIGGMVVCTGITIAIACVVRGDRSWGRIERFVRGTSGAGRGWPGRLVVRLSVLDRAHEGVRMLASPGTVGAAVGLRSFDLGLQATRFLLAARIAGQALPPDQALLAAAAYFIIGVIAPTGQMGFSEIGLVALNGDQFAVVVLIVRAAEMIVAIPASLAGAAWLRVDKLLRLTRRPLPSSPQPAPISAPEA